LKSLLNFGLEIKLFCPSKLLMKIFIWCFDKIGHNKSSSYNGGLNNSCHSGSVFAFREKHYSCMQKSSFNAHMWLSFWIRKFSRQFDDQLQLKKKWTFNLNTHCFVCLKQGFSTFWYLGTPKSKFYPSAYPQIKVVSHLRTPKWKILCVPPVSFFWVVFF
jgi:hypothetical protein